jgi:hypothetical protein
MTRSDVNYRCRYHRTSICVQRKVWKVIPVVRERSLLKALRVICVAFGLFVVASEK